MWCCIDLKTLSKGFVALVTIVFFCGILVYKSVEYMGTTNVPIHRIQSAKNENGALEPTVDSDSRSWKVRENDVTDVTYTNSFSQSTVSPTSNLTSITDQLDKTMSISSGSFENQENSNDDLHKRDRRTKVGPIKEKGSRSKYEDMFNIQRDKEKHFREKCIQLKCKTEITDPWIKVIKAAKYNLACKLVPKVGSTFLIQAFTILNNKGDKNVFKKARKDVHIGNGIDFKRKISVKKRNNRTILLPSRNPYSRLFSAYVDKVFLPNNYRIPLELFKRNRETLDVKKQCPFNRTFKEFLEYALDLKINGRIGRGHYNPIAKSIEKCSILCNVLNPIIVNQESFSADVEYALQHVGVKKHEYDTIYKAMHEHNVKYTIPGIVETVYAKMAYKYKYGKKSDLKYFSKNCLDWPDVARRLWKSFQIQGYIRDTSNFPSKAYRALSQYADHRFLSNLILQEISQNPLTSTEKTKQRNKAMLTAYGTISQELKDKIKRVYRYDFELFGYNPETILG